MTLNPNGTFTNERTEQELTRDIFTHIRQILERDGDKAEILFNHIQLRKLLMCEPSKPFKFAGGSGGLGNVDPEGTVPLKRR